MREPLVKREKIANKFSLEALLSKQNNQFTFHFKFKFTLTFIQVIRTKC